MSPLLIRYPWVWLWRFRHRRGYGIHSPWAYSFVRDVILERTPYYEYACLAVHHPWYERWLYPYRIECLRLLFRLSNYADGLNFDIYSSSTEYDEADFDYIANAKPDMEMSQRHDQGVADLVLVKADAFREYQLKPCKMLIIEGIHRDAANRAHWEAIKADARTGCSFDVYMYGIVFFDLERHKQHYIVNF